MPVDNTNVVMPNPLLPQIKQLERKVGELTAYDAEKTLLWKAGARDELEKWVVAAKAVMVSKQRAPPSSRY
jgi:hypothetical protein